MNKNTLACGYILTSLYRLPRAMCSNRPLKSIFEATDTKQEQARKRSLCAINKYSEPVSNTVATTQIVSQRSAKDVSKNQSKKEKTPNELQREQPQPLTLV